MPLLALPPLLAVTPLLPARAQTMVQVQTSQGPLVGEAPITAADFPAHARGGDWRDMFFHRSVRICVLQGGGFRRPEGGSVGVVTSRGAISNEFSAQRSSPRGTVAMAKVGGDPDSASSQWFVNLANDSAGQSSVDTRKGGLTVFARVGTPGISVADRVAALPVAAGSCNSTFADLPVARPATCQTVRRSHVALVSELTELPRASESGRTFDDLEMACSQHRLPSRGSAGFWESCARRDGTGSKACVGVEDGKVYHLVPAINGNINELGTVAEWLAVAQGASC